MLSQLLLQVRSGRDRDAARLDSLATKLAASSRDILKNRASILTLLYSLSKDAGCNKENQVHSSYQSLSLDNKFVCIELLTMKFQVPSFFSSNPSSSSLSQPPVLRSSKSTGTGLGGYHPPLPPKPRSRPGSQYGGQTETDSDNSRHAALPIAPGATSALSKASPSDLELVRELLFVFQVILSDTSVRFSSCYFQGIEGSLIRYDEGKFSLSKKMSLPSHQRCAVLKLCEVGWLYRQVHSFTEAKSADQSYGLVGHSFVTALREELTEYYR